jgi:CHAD domain-containing protein
LHKITMAYRFVPADASVQDAVRRIAAGQLDRALRSLSGPEGHAPAAIHGVRKSVKKLRGLIRLARPGFRDYDRENAALRGVGHSLAALRDSDVMAQTLANLADGTMAFPTLAAALADEGAARRDPAAIAAAIGAAEATLRDIAARAPHWRIRGEGFDTPARALARSHAAAARAMGRLTSPPRPEEIHDWRKRAKDVLYQMQLIEPFWPALLSVRVRETDRLTEILGEFNDIAVLMTRAAATPLPADEAMHLETRAGLRQAELLAGALPLGRRLLAGDPAAMAALWTDLWRIWRSEGG